MAVKKGILDNFLKPSSHYSDNQKNFRAIFIDKNEDDLKPDPKNFLESSILGDSNPSGTHQEHIKNTIGTQNNIPEVKNNEINHIDKKYPSYKKDTKGTHQEHNWNTNRKIKDQLEHKRNTSGTQLEHVKQHNQEHIKNTIGTQKEHLKNTEYRLSYLTGIQKQLLTFFYLSCKKTRSHTTEEFSLINVANSLEIKLGSVKTSLRRLEEKGFISSVQFKKGRGGWTKFKLPDDIYRELLEKEHNWNTIGTQLEHVRNTYRNTEKDTNASSSSSLNINTTTNEQIDNLDDQWNFDISNYASFGFTFSHLKQLAKLQVISASDVEQSLVEFSYDLENNTLPRIKTNKINFLMGLLRAGHNYTSETYRNEQEQLIKLMAERASQKKKTQLEEKFIVWESQLSEDDKKKIVSNMAPNLMVLYNAHGLNNNEIRKHFFNYYVSKCST